ncbi:MAG: thioredoxin family protein [Polyangiaceae bacterium]
MKSAAFVACFVLVGCAVGCAKNGDAARVDSTSSGNLGTTTTASVTASAATPMTAQGSTHATIGQPAPGFALKDLDGKTVSLSDFKGKVVVLEWFNPGCPFVRASHTRGSLRELPQKAVQNGVVWLAVNSSAAGKDGNGVEASRKGTTAYKMSYPVLLDESGAVGHAYGATNTPNMYVIDKAGTLIYSGAIDNSPDGEGESPTGPKLVNYVSDALDSLAAGKPVAVSQTKAYGCGVKYGS